jgi:hypothetical protein
MKARTDRGARHDGGFVAMQCDIHDAHHWTTC